jgi:hypothetical protein
MLSSRVKSRKWSLSLSRQDSISIKCDSRNTTPLEQAKAEIVREISQKNIDDGLKAATSGVHSELNEQYFSPRRAAAPPRIPGRIMLLAPSQFDL